MLLEVLKECHNYLSKTGWVYSKSLFTKLVSSSTGVSQIRLLFILSSITTPQCYFDKYAHIWSWTSPNKMSKSEQSVKTLHQTIPLFIPIDFHSWMYGHVRDIRHVYSSGLILRAHAVIKVQDPVYSIVYLWYVTKKGSLLSYNYFSYLLFYNIKME